MKAAGIGAEKSTPLFRTLGGRGRKQLTGDRMTRQDARRMIVEDYYPQGKRWWVRLHEKGGKQHEMPAHHRRAHDRP